MHNIWGCRLKDFGHEIKKGQRYSRQGCYDKNLLQDDQRVKTKE
jgi:hypothetical protein